MNILRRTLHALFICVTIIPFPIQGKTILTVNDQTSPGSIDLTKATIIYDSEDERLIAEISEMLSSDIRSVCQKKIDVITSMPKSSVVIIGTVGHNRWIDRLVSEKKLNIKQIAGGWEQFVIKVIDKPFKGIDKALVIAGSDKRGAAYGTFTVSEAIGVSPWYWWADIPVQPRHNLFISADYTSKSPSVKLRGIFINDEDWGLKTWSTHNFEKELGDIGPKTYAKVCELILRLKGNMLAPAMHECTGAFYTHAENKSVADKYGIMITTSHCEPLLFNNASKLEWDSKIDGEWDYKANGNAIIKKLDNRVKEASPYDNVYTLAMRGLHDGGMRGNYTDKEKVAILSQAISDQRDILKKHIDRPIEEIPQIFIPYKEAQDLYERGLQVPDDVTLVWVDDNYGYIKKLSNPEEQKRSGRAGVYYHLSYLGAPHDYLWLNTTPPALMYEELKKAYDLGADRYWLLNVGDIKPMELGMTTFFEMAYDIDAFNFGNINRHQAEFLSLIYGEKYRSTFQWLLDNYYRLAWSRKPEFMGWEREWDSNPKLEVLANTDFSFENHNDARNRLSDYKAISDKANQILSELPENLRPSFYEIVAYPILASYQMNRKFLMAQLNHQRYSRMNFHEANWAAEQSIEAFDSINALTYLYNHQLEGKWNHIMALGPGWCAKHQFLPELRVLPGFDSKEIDIMPVEQQADRNGFDVVNLADYTINGDKAKNDARLIEGLGYDWQVLQLGDATGQTTAPESTDALKVNYNLGNIDADSVEITVYTLPIFPIYRGKGTQMGLSVDNDKIIVYENQAKEYSDLWKDQVLRNSTIYKHKFPVDRSKDSHTLTLSCIDPGIIVQRIIIDYGGLKKTYVGPEDKDFRRRNAENFSSITY